MRVKHHTRARVRQPLEACSQGVCTNAIQPAITMLRDARCVDLLPLNAAANRALGLAAEARGNASEAVSAYELALELSASSDMLHGAPGRSA